MKRRGEGGVNTQNKKKSRINIREKLKEILQSINEPLMKDHEERSNLLDRKLALFRGPIFEMSQEEISQKETEGRTRIERECNESRNKMINSLTRESPKYHLLMRSTIQLLEQKKEELGDLRPGQEKFNELKDIRDLRNGMVHGYWVVEPAVLVDFALKNIDFYYTGDLKQEYTQSPFFSKIKSYGGEQSVLKRFQSVGMDMDELKQSYKNDILTQSHNILSVINNSNIISQDKTDIIENSVMMIGEGMNALQSRLKNEFIPWCKEILGEEHANQIVAITGLYNERNLVSHGGNLTDADIELLTQKTIPALYDGLGGKLLAEYEESAAAKSEDVSVASTSRDIAGPSSQTTAIVEGKLSQEELESTGLLGQILSDGGSSTSRLETSKQNPSSKSWAAKAEPNIDQSGHRK